MAKPTITKRVTKGAALTYSELDTNFQNLADATVTITGGSTAVTADLNGNITLVAGTNVTITGNNTAKTITINSSAAGSGTVDTGTVNRLAYYPSTGDLVDSSSLATYSTSTEATLSAEPTSGGTLKLMSKNDKTSIRLYDDTNGILIDTRSTSPSGGDLYLQCYNGVELDAASGSFQFRTTYSSGDFTNGIQFVGQYVLMPVRTTAQRDALTAQNGMIIYNDDTGKFQGRAGGSWVDLH